MEIFNKIGKQAGNLYKTTTKKTNKLAKETKLKFKINGLKSEIDDIYSNIGQIVYKKHLRKDDYDISKTIEEQCIKLDCLSDEIDTCLKQSLYLNNKIRCTKCYSDIEANAKFCPQCGQKINE